MWFQVARVIKQHELVQLQNIERSPDFYSQKNCSYQYYMLVENLHAESQALRHDVKNDMPVVVRLARHLYLQRVDEIKHSLAQDQKEFNQLAIEIHSIKAGEWDHKLKADQSSPVEDLNHIVARQLETEPIIEEPGHNSGTIGMNLCLPAKKDSIKDSCADSTLMLDESQMKRTSNDNITPEPHLLKRSRLSDVNEEEQVLSTAISDVLVDETYKNFTIDKVMEEKLDRTNLHVEPVLEKKNISPVGNQSSEGTAMELDVAVISPKYTKEQFMQTTKISNVEAENEEQNIHVPKITIPEGTESSLQLQQIQSISPISKTNVLVPEDEDLTGSETNTPTSTKRNSEQRQKAWQKNINLLWQEIANHKNGTMFLNPIKKSHAPMYDEVVKQPLYLKTIKNRVRDGIVRTTAEFERDIVLMLTNSLMYNKEGTEMYLMAQEMLDDVREQLRLFKSADRFSASFWESEQ
ncbi:hypothetical protein [Parasitella parasitica]|uniref:Bromo domain-containing protein n=1 Tax=Parasitella parasitica TaxID=35722 RepID=A0A0B7N3A8_9FUNG|nr:hypothetical protein [Parasitella parasitica]